MRLDKVPVAITVRLGWVLHGVVVAFNTKMRCIMISSVATAAPDSSPQEKSLQRREKPHLNPEETKIRYNLKYNQDAPELHDRNFARYIEEKDFAVTWRGYTQRDFIIAKVAW